MIMVLSLLLVVWLLVSIISISIVLISTTSIIVMITVMIIAYSHPLSSHSARCVQSIPTCRRSLSSEISRRISERFNDSLKGENRILEIPEECPYVIYHVFTGLWDCRWSHMSTFRLNRALSLSLSLSSMCILCLCLAYTVIFPSCHEVRPLTYRKTDTRNIGCPSLHKARFWFGTNVVIQVLLYRLSFLIRQIISN